MFIISYLHDTARDWAKEILEDEYHSYFDNFQAFKTALDNLYIDHNLKHQARDKFLTLKQNKSAPTYIIEFQQIIIPLKFNDEIKCLMFYNDLKSIVKDMLALIGEMEKFKDLIDQVINIDQRQFHRLREEKKVSSLLKNPFKSLKSSSKPFDDQKRPGTPDLNSDSPFKKHISNQPHDLISDEEKQHHHDENLCFRCDSPDYKIEDYSLGKRTVTHNSTRNTYISEYIIPKLSSEN